MSRNWALALVAAALWAAAYVWYFVGVARLRGYVRSSAQALGACFTRRPPD